MSDREIPTRKRIGRREVIGAVAAGAVGGAAGVALGYRYRTELLSWKLAMRSWPLVQPAGADDFQREAARINARHRAQTAETVSALKAKYESPVFGHVPIWDLVEELALCIDQSDMRLFCGSQYVHFQQILAAMEKNGVTDPDMLVIAIIHDLGKVLLRTGELPENVVCVTGRIEGGEEGAGLDKVVFQFGHGEFIYSRLKGHVPDHIAWVARYHNINEPDVRRFMNEQEREWSEKYLLPFKQFDGRFVSPYYVPELDMVRYRTLVESYFPSPLLV